MYITQEVLNERNQFLQNRDYSQNTILNYKTDVKLFLNFIRIQNKNYYIEDTDITMEKIEKWRTQLAKLETPKNSIYYKIKPTLSPSTIQSKITAIKSFLKFVNLIYDKGLDYKKIETKRIKSDYIEYITENEYNQLFDFIGRFEKYKINSLRFQLLVNIGYTSGLRLSEMLGLTVGEIKKKEIRIVGKGNKPRRVFFTNSTL
jgi:integrase/recombinase XerD